ncbi:MAG TPA: methyltransferase domain-containing protein [Puia sp.]|nr:methyltransferase domain-containing protein [Puia sp.]
MDLTFRSDKKELLDSDGIPFDAIRANMEELDLINSRLGGHRTTINGFKQLLKNQKEVVVCEIGCGGGDNLMAIHRWCKRRGIAARFIGIDINPDCVAIARAACDLSNFIFIASDYRQINFDKDRPDIIFSSLFCHHFSHDELVYMMQWMIENSSKGIFINDLHRHAIAYYSIFWLTRAFSNSYLVKNDAPLSVLRGFRRKEWLEILGDAGFTPQELSWRWAFRWLIVIRKKSTDCNGPGTGNI